MARVEAQRKKEGAGSEFWRYSRRISKPNFERYLRDHPHITSKLKAWTPHDQTTEGYIEAILPPHIVVLTPSPSLNLGDGLHSIESALFTIRNYFRSTFTFDDRGRPDFHKRKFIFYDSGAGDDPCSRGLFRQVPDPKTLSRITRHFDCMKTFFQAEDPLDLCWLIGSYMLFNSVFRLTELAHLWLFHARDLCLTLNGLHHPLSKFICTLITFSEGEARKHHKLINLSLQVTLAHCYRARAR